MRLQPAREKLHALLEHGAAGTVTLLFDAGPMRLPRRLSRRRAAVNARSRRAQLRPLTVLGHRDDLSSTGVPQYAS